jgi:transcriptional regulator with XRE-family HTH domain
MKISLSVFLKQKGVTQRELAEQLKMSEVGLSKLINGNPTINSLAKIANALGVSLAELFEAQKQPEGIILCPHCGGKIKISKN